MTKKKSDPQKSIVDKDNADQFVSEPSQVAQLECNAAVAPYDEGDYETELRNIKNLAEQEDPVAQYQLGMLYEQAFHKFSEAAKWYRKAADQGNYRAQNNLALMYERGRGVPQDHAEAERLYLKSVEQGNKKACYNLGNLYAGNLDNGRQYTRGTG